MTTGTENRPLTKKDFSSDQEVRWCPGCGDYGILSAIQKTMPELGIPKEDIVFISGIGCSSRFPYYMNTYGFHTIHGRAPAFASGLKITNPDLSVWVITGDGDGLSIGGNHLIHAIRRNMDINILLFNNEIYGLTKGQYSPTSLTGTVTKSTPYGSIDTPFRPLSVALGAEATFVARTHDKDQKHMVETFRRAAEHKGTSFVEVLQNCVIFNDGIHDKTIAKDVREDAIIYLKHNESLLYGKNRDKGLVIKDSTAHSIAVDETNREEVQVHDEKMHRPNYAFLLSRLYGPDSPVPMGVFRAVEKPVYNQEINQQISQIREKKGKGNLEELLYSSDTWEVK
ncbi:MAG: 2-oxoacid:ferredoxin oxidoreductase subunit beta [Spirochaetota bacterium]